MRSGIVSIVISIFNLIIQICFGELDYDNAYLCAINGLTPLSKLDNCKNRLISILKNQMSLIIFFIL